MRGKGKGWYKGSKIYVLENHVLINKPSFFVNLTKMVPLGPVSRFLAATTPAYYSTVNVTHS